MIIFKVMKMFRFLFLVLLGIIALDVSETHIKWTIGLIFLIIVFAVRWSMRGKLPDVKDNSSKFI